MMPYLFQMQPTILDLSQALRRKEHGYAQFADNLEQRLLERDTPVHYRKTQTPQQLALKYAGQFPNFEPEMSKYGFNYWEQYWDRVDTLRDLTAAGQGTSARLL